MRTNGNRNDNIAVRAAVDAGTALSAQCNALAFVDARRNLNFQRAGTALLTGAAALLTRLADNLAGAMTIRTRSGRRERAEWRSLRLLHSTGTMTIRTGLRCIALFCAGAAALGALFRALNLNLLFTAKCRFFKAKHHGAANGLTLTRCIGAIGAGRTAAESAAKEASENIAQIDVLEAAKACASLSCSIIRVYARKAELIVTGTLLGVRQYLIGLADFLELFRSFRIILI